MMVIKEMENHYTRYHRNPINVGIHKVCVPLLLASFYSMLSLRLATMVNVAYSVQYLLYDMGSKKSQGSVAYLQVLYLLHFVFRRWGSFEVNVGIHVGSWVLQIIGHRVYEKNTPALLDRPLSSIVFAPYFVFLETFYGGIDDKVGTREKKYTLVWDSEYDAGKKTIVYFAGLFQRSQVEWGAGDGLTAEYNRVFVNVRFEAGDVFKDVLKEIAAEIEGTCSVECVVGFSFGGALALQFRDVIRNQNQNQNDSVRCVLVSPGGFLRGGWVESAIRGLSRVLYSWYGNSKWYCVSQYPVYQNTYEIEERDLWIGSSGDWIHPPLPLPRRGSVSVSGIENANRIVVKHVSHLKMISVVNRQKIVSQWIRGGYSVDRVAVKPLSSVWSQLLFGGHFFPYHIGLWSSVSVYNMYRFVDRGYAYTEFLGGFFFASVLSSLTEYLFHRYLLHWILYVHHKKHHAYPNKLSIIHTPMSVVCANWLLYYSVFRRCLSDGVLTSYSVFFPLYYLSFEITHLLTHSYQGSNRVIRNAKYYHKLHHIHDRVNYSFLTPFWDYVFGTLSPDYRVSAAELVFGAIPFYSFLVHRPCEFGSYTFGKEVD